MRVGDEFLKRTGSEQQRKDVGATRLVTRGHAIGKVVALLLELRLLGVDLLLGLVNLALHALDIVERLGVLVGKRRILVGDAIELGLDLVELGLRGIQFVGGFLAGLGSMGTGRQAKKNGGRSSTEQGLKGSAARELLGKDGIIAW